ncbi:MAG: YneF family protein, partial [Epsilonproteobacteria bacterium]|nr:YneF family protein [Campylobacterota bacterium]
MEVWSWILLIVLALIGGLVAGFFGSRWLFKRELAKNP